jgi:acyl transferase domain-containing protein
MQLQRVADADFYTILSYLILQSCSDINPPMTPCLTDPQQRLLLDCAAEVLLTTVDPVAGLSNPSGSLNVTPQPVVGAFVGISSADYNKLALRQVTVMALLTMTGYSHELTDPD